MYIERMNDYSTNIKDILDLIDKDSLFISSWDKEPLILNFSEQIIEKSINNTEHKNTYIMSKGMDKTKQLIENYFIQNNIRITKDNFTIVSNGTSAGFISFLQVYKHNCKNVLFIGPVYFTYYQLMKIFQQECFYMSLDLFKKIHIDIDLLKKELLFNNIQCIIIPIPFFFFLIDMDTKFLKELSIFCEANEIYILIDYILDLVEYDYHINKYFYPILAEKKNDETKEIEQEIKKYTQQKDRLMDAYKAGILKMEDFAEDYKVIENKLSILENKRLDALDLDNESYNPQHIMAERDIEREKLTDGQIYKDILLNLWIMKTKEEKQELISKFIEYAVLKKDENNGFILEKINFRSTFIEQIDKLYNKGVVDIPKRVERGGNIEDIRMSVNMNKAQLNDYLDKLKEELDIEYMDLGEYYYHDDKFDEEYDNKNPSVEFKNKVLEFKIKNNRKIIRAVSLHEKQNFLAKPCGKIRLGLVTRIPSKKKLK